MTHQPAQSTGENDERPRTKRRKRKTQPASPLARLSAAFDAAYQRIVIEAILRQRPLPSSRDGRHIPLDPDRLARESLEDERRAGPYVSNFIRSTRYSLASFLPKQLFFQFSKLANFYFLVVGCLQLVPGFSTTGRWNTLAPMACFVSFSIAKEGYDDWRRYRMDRSENGSEAWVLSTPAAKGRPRRGKPNRAARVSRAKARDDDPEDGWIRILWDEVVVGDVVRLRRDDAVPADMVLLHATGPSAVAYVDTMALDGETNLKSKRVAPLLAESCATVEALRSCRAEIVSEDPNPNLYAYEGRVRVGEETAPLGLENVLLRGSTLRNTAEAVGLVVSSGEECKIRENAHIDVRTKSPAIQVLVNRLVAFLIVVLLAISLGLTWGHYLADPARRNAWYLISVPFYQVFFGYIIMFSTIIPLSLYVSLEIVKIFQLYFLAGDVEMYDSRTDTPVGANTATILENLGQVNYLFSDKTGTLTENVMRFRNMTVVGTACYHPHGESDSGRASVGLAGPVESDHIGQLISTPGLLNYVRRTDPDAEFSRRAHHFLLCVALCHTCLPETIGSSGAIAYQTASPDELALIEAARELGYVLVSRGADTVALEIDQHSRTYQVLDVIGFSSARKRMSVIVRMPEDGRICIITKGADSAVLPRLRNAALARERATAVQQRAGARRDLERQRLVRQSKERRSNSSRYRSSRRPNSPATAASHDEKRVETSEQEGEDESAGDGESVVAAAAAAAEAEAGATATAAAAEVAATEALIRHNLDLDEGALLERTFEHMDEFASRGLRTLLYGFAYIDEDEYVAWRENYQEATTSLDDRQVRIERAAELIEANLELAGATAIEDQLQDGVPETVDKLRRAGIKVWMLTGDKRETAINIGYAAGLCRPESSLYVLDATRDEAEASPRGVLVSILAAAAPPGAPDPSRHSVLVVDGHTLAVIESGGGQDDDDDDDGVADLFYKAIAAVDSVICCRASPAQKADLVTHVRQKIAGSVTLAIGDGSNDIGMIQTSHVGVGISGREGLQAARIADYSVGQFRFLQRLLLVHGRWMYGRTAKYVLATFWKELVFYLVQAHFQQWTLYTGTSLYESLTLAVFNVLFTSVPVIFMGIVACDLRAETLLLAPELYASFGPQNRGLNVIKYLEWAVAGVIESLVVFWLFWGWYRQAESDQDISLFAEGMVPFTGAVLFINVKILFFEVHNINLIICFGLSISVVGWWVWNLVISKAYPARESVYLVHDTFLSDFGRRPFWWGAAMLGLVTLIMAETAGQTLRRVLWPTDVDIMQQAEREGRVADMVADEYGRDEEEGGAKDEMEEEGDEGGGETGGGKRGRSGGGDEMEMRSLRATNT